MKHLRIVPMSLVLALGTIVLSACFPEASNTSTLPPVPTRQLQVTATTAVPVVGGDEICRDEVTGASMTYAEAVAVAQTSGCTSQGALLEQRDCNGFTGTWWLALDINQPGCMPACVVDVQSGTAVINYRCTGAIPPEEPAEVTPVLPTPTTGLEPGVLQEVSFQGISFAYSDSLAQAVIPTMVPTQDFMILPGAIIPDHEEFSFDQYVLPDAFQKPMLAIFPTAEFASGNELVPAILERQARLLAEKPSSPSEPIPFLPLVNAGPLIQAQIEYLQFPSGEGVRYLTQFGQAYLPIVKRSLFYTFQGITKDGAYYVSLVLPVNHPSLPATEDDYPGWTEESFATNYDQYATSMIDQLNSQEASSYFPDLSMLDDIVRSLVIDKEPQGVPASEAYDYSGWQPYANEAVGYTFYYPPGTAVREDGQNGQDIQAIGANSESLPLISVKHYDSEFFRPPEGTEVGQWVLEHGIPHDVFDGNARVGGRHAAHLTTEPSLSSYGFDEYYVIIGSHLLQIIIWPTEGTTDPLLYEQFLAGFTF